MKDNKQMEQKLRRVLSEFGYALHKSRKRTWSYDDQCGYLIADWYNNTVVGGSHYDYSLDDVAEWVECNC